MRVFNPQGQAIGHIHLPERCANLCWGGPKNNRLYMASSHSLYALHGSGSTLFAAGTGGALLRSYNGTSWTLPPAWSRSNLSATWASDAHNLWMAGAGVKRGIAYGSSDDFGFNVAENPVHIHDLQATILHQLGIDHERLTFRFQGRQYRLTDVHGEVIRRLVA